MSPDDYVSVIRAYLDPPNIKNARAAPAAGEYLAGRCQIEPTTAKPDPLTAGARHVRLEAWTVAQPQLPVRATAVPADAADSVTISDLLAQARGSDPRQLDQLFA